MYAIYSFLLTLGAVATAPYWIYRAFRERKYLRNFLRRFGTSLPAGPPVDRPVWIHAVSVGEVLAAKPLLTALQASRPALSFIISTVTLTGNALARKELGGASAHVFFPFDWRFCINRYLDRIQPRAVILMETELWPNFIGACAERSIPLALANGRISDRSWGRYRLARWFVKRLLAHLSVIAVQTGRDRDRFLMLGARDGQVQVTGNLKFDFPLPPASEGDELLQSIRQALGLGQDGRTIVVGSSMKDEETLYLEAFVRVLAVVPEATLILAPRHPERFDEVAGMIEAAGLRFIRRSQLAGPIGLPVPVLLLDSIGELRRVYSLAAVTVIGGSFLPFGGHNLLEPAALGKAIVFGPHMFNFREVAHIFAQAQAARAVSAGDLADSLIGLLSDDKARAGLGQKALRTMQQNRGAAARTLELILPHLGR